MPTKKATTAKSTRNKQTTAKAKKSASPKGRAAGTKATTKAGDREVTLDRRSTPDRRSELEGETTDSAAKPQLERRAKVQRRRQIDPTTCERDYSVEEVEFMNAMDEYKRTSGRMFPTCSEVLEVIRKMGYVKLSPTEMAALQPKDDELPKADALGSNLSEDESDSEEDLEAASVSGWTL